MNVGLLLEMAGAGAPDRTVATADDQAITFEELTTASGRLARRIVADGFDAVVFCGPNDLSFPIALFGASLAGVPFVPLNYRLGSEQLASLLGGHPGALVVADHSALPDINPNRSLERHDLTVLDDVDAALPSFIDPDEVAVVLYTSGTTGTPKAALLRHRHLAAYVIGTVEFGVADQDEVALVTVPPYHVAGLANLLSNLYAGRSIVYLDAFDAAAWLETVRRHSITQAMVVPTMLARIVQHLDGRPADVPTLRTLSYGGSRMPPAILEQALDLFAGVGFVNAYGLTETSSTIALLGPDDHEAARSGDDAAKQRLSSVGRIVPGIEIQVRADNAEVLAVGEVGLVFLRGDQVSGEYIGGSILDADGWFPTRDRGWIDADGYLFIEGRADDTIIRGGENIAPAEIEDVLGRHPHIVDVVVLGVPDDEWGQLIAAVIVPTSGAVLDAEEVRGHVRQHLRGSKTPDLVFVRDALPRTPTGKILRREILADLTAEPPRGTNRTRARSTELPVDQR